MSSKSVLDGPSDVKKPGVMLRDLHPKKIVLGLLLALVMVSGNAFVGSETPGWMDLPALDLRPSVSLERHLGPNPFSQSEDDYLVITGYEEKLHETGEIKEDGSFLNVYLVNGLLMHPDHPEGIIHDTQLIVSRWAYDRGSATKTAYQWGFAFNESDGLLEKVIYQVIVEDSLNNILSLTEKELPYEEIKKMQPYFDRAMDKMVEKAQEDSRGALAQA
jgi:hypothetical protein